MCTVSDVESLFRNLSERFGFHSVLPYFISASPKEICGDFSTHYHLWRAETTWNGRSTGFVSWLRHLLTGDPW